MRKSFVSFSRVRENYTILIRADVSNKRIVKSGRFVRDQCRGNPSLMIYGAEKRAGKGRDLPSGAKYCHVVDLRGITEPEQSG